MTAAEHRIIIERGADFSLRFRATMDGVSAINLTGSTVRFDLRYVDEDGNDEAQVIPAGAAGLTTGVYNVADGEGFVLIDKVATALIPTRVIGDNPFGTEFRYYYTVTIEDIDMGLNPDIKANGIRILRGRCAVRL